MVDFKALRVIRPGLHMGTLKKNRFEPSHGLALYLRQDQVKQWYELEENSSLSVSYLKGQIIKPEAEFKGI